jgi:HTH-type transcriptional regulator/antitoxin HigA
MESAIMQRVASTQKHALPKAFDELVRLFPPRPIHDEVGYDNMQEMIDRLTSMPKRSKGQSEYLGTLAILFSAYEGQHHAIEDVPPVEMLKHLMKQHDMSASDLGRVLGERSLGSKILNGDREMSKSHIRKLAAHFGVSASLFI